MGKRSKKNKKEKRPVFKSLSKASNLNDVINRLTRMKNIKCRNRAITQCNDKLIRELSPRIRKGLKYISPLLTTKGHSSLCKFISNRTPIHVRRQMIRGQIGGGVGSWFTNLIGSIVPILGRIL